MHLFARGGRGAWGARGARGGRPVAGLVAALLCLTLPGRPGFAQRFVPGEEPELPRIEFADSLVSLNDRCIVRGTRLNLRIRPVYVNGQPIGFC